MFWVTILSHDWLRNFGELRSSLQLPPFTDLRSCGRSILDFKMDWINIETKVLRKDDRQSKIGR